MGVVAASLLILAQGGVWGDMTDQAAEAERAAQATVDAAAADTAAVIEEPVRNPKMQAIAVRFDAQLRYIKCVSAAAASLGPAAATPAARQNALLGALQHCSAERSGFVAATMASVGGDFAKALDWFVEINLYIENEAIRLIEDPSYEPPNP